MKFLVLIALLSLSSFVLADYDNTTVAYVLTNNTCSTVNQTVCYHCLLPAPTNTTANSTGTPTNVFMSFTCSSDSCVTNYYMDALCTNKTSNETIEAQKNLDDDCDDKSIDACAFYVAKSGVGSENYWIYILVAVGVVILLLVVIAVIAAFVMYRKKKMSRDEYLVETS